MAGEHRQHRVIPAPRSTHSQQLSAAAGQLGARLIRVVHLGQRDDAGAVAAVELEGAVAGPNSWILSSFPAASSTVFPASKATSRPRVSPKNWTAAA